MPYSILKKNQQFIVLVVIDLKQYKYLIPASSEQLKFLLGVQQKFQSHFVSLCSFPEEIQMIEHIFVTNFVVKQFLLRLRISFFFIASITTLS